VGGSVEVYCGYRDESGTPTEALDHQEEYHLYTGWAKHHLMAGSLGTGKTEAMCVEAVKQCAEIPKNFGLMGRKVLDAFKKSTLLQLLDVGSDFIERHRPVDHLIEFKNGSKIIYMALDDSRDAIQRIKSLNLGWFAFDQLEEVPEDTFISAAGQLRRKGTQRCSFHTCNPAGHNWVWKRWKKGKDAQNSVQGGYRLIETKTWTEGALPPTTEREVRLYSDNPHLPPDYISWLLEMPERWVKRYVYCSWDDFVGLVYPMFDEKIHFIKQFEVPDWWNHYVVYDYGYKNPSCVLFAAVDGDGKIWVYDLIYESELLIDDLGEMVCDRLNPDIDYIFLADPSINRTERDGRTIAEEWDKFDIFWQNAKNDKRVGYDKVGRCLQPDEKGFVGMSFFDVPQMSSLRDEIVEYKWKELRYGREDRPQPEEAVKVNDHSMDCLRYLVNYVDSASKPMMLKSDPYGDWSGLMNSVGSKLGWMSE